MTTTELEAIEDAIDCVKELKQRMVEGRWHRQERLDAIQILQSQIERIRTEQPK